MNWMFSWIYAHDAAVADAKARRLVDALHRLAPHSDFATLDRLAAIEFRRLECEQGPAGTDDEIETRALSAYFAAVEQATR